MRIFTTIVYCMYNSMSHEVRHYMSCMHTLQWATVMCGIAVSNQNWTECWNNKHTGSVFCINNHNYAWRLYSVWQFVILQGMCVGGISVSSTCMILIRTIGSGRCIHDCITIIAWCMHVYIACGGDMHQFYFQQCPYGKYACALLAERGT